MRGFTTILKQDTNDPQRHVQGKLLISSKYGFRFIYIWFCQQVKKCLSLRTWNACQATYLKNKTVVFLNVVSWGEFYISVVQGTHFWLTSTFLEQTALSESESREKKQSDQQEEQMVQMEENTDRWLSMC